MLMFTIDTLNLFQVIRDDIPGSFIQLNMDYMVRVVLDGIVAKILTKIDPGLQNEFMVIDHGHPVIYASLSNMPYETLRASLISW